MIVSHRHLDPTPPRPPLALAEPAGTLTVEVHVAMAHLSNPLLAVQRLLASEAGALARVTGDETCFRVAIALPDDDDAGRDQALGWVRWAVHNAGVRGDLQVLDGSQLQSPQLPATDVSPRGLP